MAEKTVVSARGIGATKGALGVAASLSCFGRRLYDVARDARDAVDVLACDADIRARVLVRRAASERGQGTTEYAILVGVLVVIAIVAVTAFRGKLQELWTGIADGVNSL